jgi:hypothetical protein
MDTESTPGEIKGMVKYAMGHANYQGLMTGMTFVGIALLDRGVVPTSNCSMVSLRMVLFHYFKMEDKFSIFAELHQNEELGPVLAIIPACKEAECLVHVMNKQVAAFLYYFLKDAALAKRFLMALLCETCNATLVAEVQECDWEKDTQTITTPHEKKQDHNTEDLKIAIWYKKAFDLKGLGKAAKSATNKAPKAFFNLDAKNSIKTIQNCHLQPAFTLEVEDSNS